MFTLLVTLMWHYTLLQVHYWLGAMAPADDSSVFPVHSFTARYVKQCT
jgi:hypothetical protein